MLVLGLGIGRLSVRVRARVRVRLRLRISREKVSVRVQAGRQGGWSTFGLACFGLKNPVEDVRTKTRPYLSFVPAKRTSTRT
jgi:hypothetical protein